MSSIFTPEALFFDLDGTLVDGRHDVQLALEEVLAAAGRPLSPEESGHLVGRTWEDMHAWLSLRKPVPISVPEMARAISSTRLHNIRTRGPVALPGAPEVVARLGRERPCVLVTGSNRAEAESIVDALGLGDSFRFLLCAGDAPAGKPAPDPYLLAARRLGVTPSTGLAVEDSMVGIASARAAGLFCVAVRAGNHFAQDQSAAHHIVDTLYDLLTWLQTSEQTTSSSLRAPR